MRIVAMQAYNSELRECLLHLSCTTDERVQNTMQQLALEALRLAGCRLVMNPAEHLSLITGRMNHGHEAQHSLDHAFYVKLLVSKHSATQTVMLTACMQTGWALASH